MQFQDFQKDIRKHGQRINSSFSNGALYTFCTVSIIIYTVIFVKGIFSIKVSYAVAAVIVMLALILIGIYLTKKGGIRIETSLWDPSVKKGGKVRWRQLM